MSERDDTLEARVAALEADLAIRKDFVTNIVGDIDRLSHSLSERDAGVHDVKEEVAALKYAGDENLTQIAAVQHAIKLLELRLRRLEAIRTGAARPATAAPRPATAAPAAHPPPASTPPASTPAAEQVPEPPAAASDEAGTGVVHLDELAPIQEVVRATAGKWLVPYVADPESDVADSAKHRVVLVNFAMSVHDPFSAVLAQRRAEQRVTVVAYATDGTRGLMIGVLDFLPPPLDPQGCANQLLGRATKPQKLLLVSDDLDIGNPLRDALNAGGCTTSMAFDGRQALDLVRMIKPN